MLAISAPSSKSCPQLIQIPPCFPVGSTYLNPINPRTREQCVKTNYTTPLNGVAPLGSWKFAGKFPPIQHPIAFVYLSLLTFSSIRKQ